jgi:hypothetical protein
MLSFGLCYHLVNVIIWLLLSLSSCPKSDSFCCKSVVYVDCKVELVIKLIQLCKQSDFLCAAFLYFIRC